MKDTFASFHPIVNFLYFTLVLGFAMFLMHPVCLGVSLASAIAYAIYLNGQKAVRFQLKYLLPLLIVTTLLNPFLNHEGATILAYFHSGNPLTLESIAYGGAAAVMLIAVICWFSCYNVVMTSDKFVYLFGRAIPAASLLLSMTLRFAPRFTTQIKLVANAQRCLGRDMSNGSPLQRAKHGIRILSIMATWALENAIETADSMKSRGYGLSGRTAFSIYRFDKRDKQAICFLLFCGGYILLGSLSGGLHYRYFPTMAGAWLQPGSLSLYLCYLVLCIFPILINLREDRKWKVMQSKI